MLNSKLCPSSELLLTYTGALLFVQSVSFMTVAGVALGCVVTHSLAADVWADLAFVHL